MTLRELENKIGAQYQSVAAVLPASIERVALAPGETLRGLAPGAEDVSRALTLVSGAHLTKRVLAALRPRASRVLHRVFERRRGRLRSFLIDDAVATVPVAAVLLAGVDHIVGKRLSPGRFSRALLMSSFAFLLDQTLLARRTGRLFGARRRHRVLSAVTSSAIGTAYAMMGPAKAPPPEDHSGGDIAAGVPAVSGF